MHSIAKTSLFTASLAAGLLLCVDASAESAAAAEANMCIPETTRQSIDECPAGAKRSKAKERGNVPRSRLQEAKPETKGKGAGETRPGLQIDMSTRMGREAMKARAEALLHKEIRILQRLIGNTEVDDPRRPDILLRLAETQFELQQALNAKVRGFDEPVWQACTRDRNKAQCKQARQQQKGAENELRQVRQDTVRTYARLAKDHPNFRRMDEVLFSLAFGLDELREYDQARKVYRRLIKDFPKSRFIPHAYLSFAEFYFNESDMDAAAKFYRKVTEFPPKRNAVYGYALYKIAWVEYNRERYRPSLQAFVDVLEFARKNRYASDAKNLARQARRELVLPYSRFGSPGKALSFFRRYAKNDAEAHEMLESLANLYYDTGQWSKAVTTYHKLMAEAPKNNKLCDWQNNVTNAVISSRSKAQQVVELKRLIDVYRLFKKGKKPKDRKEACAANAATTLTWLSTAWHREAVGTDKQPGTRNKKTMKQAAILYRTLLKEFPNMESMEFPNIDRRDWPTAYRISYFYAELLWKSEEWGQCGPAFDHVVELDPQGEYTSDAAYAAVLCYNNLYQQQYRPRETEARVGSKWDKDREKNKKKDKFRPRKFTQLEDGMLQAFSRYVCYVDKSEDLATIKYRRARIYYEANRFDEAAVLFRDIAFNHKDSELAEYAANLYLDCLNILGTQIAKPRTACIEELSSSIDPMASAFCASPEAAEENPDLCGTLDNLQCQVRRKEAENYEKTKQFKKAAATYVRIFRRHKECGEMDEVLYNAAINFEAARLLGRAIQVRRVLIDRFPKSQWSKRAEYLIGANFHALAYYERAADYYESFARKFPGEDGKKCTKAEKDAGTCTNSIAALENAVFFRLGLSDDKKAENDADLFAKNYRRRLPRRTAQVVFSIGTIYERQKRWDQVVSHYKNYLKRYRSTAAPHHVIMANNAIGKAYWARNDRRNAKKYFQAAVKAWTRGAPKKIRALKGVDAGDKVRYIREALDGAAEAQFHLSEYGFESFKKVEFPRYRGGRTKARINKWAKGDFSRWVKKKLASLKSAEGNYNKVARMSATVNGQKMQSAPWQIAAASRVGEMYRSFVDEFRDAPVPREIEKDPELYDIYVGALDEKSEPLQKQAIERFEFCLKTATNVRWFNRWSRSCEQELHQLNPTKYPVASELRGSPDYVKGTLGEPGPVELGVEAQGDALSADAAKAMGDKS